MDEILNGVVENWPYRSAQYGSSIILIIANGGEESRKFGGSIGLKLPQIYDPSLNPKFSGQKYS
jgi:hypothetical protein